MCYACTYKYTHINNIIYIYIMSFKIKSDIKFTLIFPIRYVSISLFYTQFTHQSRTYSICIRFYWYMFYPGELCVPLQLLGFPGGSVVKNLPAMQGDMSLIPGSGRSPGEGNDYPLQYSWLENAMDREAWWAITPGVTKNTFTFNNAVIRNFIFYIFKIFSR